LDQATAARELISGLNQALHDLPSLPPLLPIPEVFQTATIQYWWAEDSLAGFTIVMVEAAFEMIRKYNALPKGVGSAATRQHFSEQGDFKTRIKDAITELEKVAL
jgi:hypothetical protein